MKNRLNKVYDYLKFKGFIKTQNDLASLMGYNRVSVSKAINGHEGYMTNEFVSKLVEIFPELDIDWLKKGIGEMLKNDNQTNSFAQSITGNGNVAAQGHGSQSNANAKDTSLTLKVKELQKKLLEAEKEIQDLKQENASLREEIKVEKEKLLEEKERFIKYFMEKS